MMAKRQILQIMHKTNLLIKKPLSEISICKGLSYTQSPVSSINQKVVETDLPPYLEGTPEVHPMHKIPVSFCHF